MYPVFCPRTLWHVDKWSEPQTLWLVDKGGAGEGSCPVVRFVPQPSWKRGCQPQLGPPIHKRKKIMIIKQNLAVILVSMIGLQVCKHIIPFDVYWHLKPSDTVTLATLYRRGTWTIIDSCMKYYMNYQDFSGTNIISWKSFLIKLIFWSFHQLSCVNMLFYISCIISIQSHQSNIFSYFVTYEEIHNFWKRHELYGNEFQEL